LVDDGQTQGFCPFYTALQNSPYSYLIFVPYNYLIDKNIRQAMKINLQNTIIIIDEAYKHLTGS